ncbi:hypothetical protein ACQP2F_37575 [Actinoplanes sp. CA-030573]|uniref:hypothetical protein n=1 Tax=Actinoplanes sp. CA-030573 TaxID=3239898 RepID=UPI003D91DC09
MTGYRLLVRAYPPGRRRAELLDTLIEAGRTHPSPREAANLLRCGLRARLGRPAGRGIVVLAALIALISGFLGAAIAARAAWEAVPGYPTGAALAEITGTLFPGTPAFADRKGEGLFFDMADRSTAQVFLHGHDEDFEFSTLILGPESRFLPGSYATWTLAAQARLAAAGWQVTAAEVTGPTDIASGTVDDTGRTFEATRGGYALRIDTTIDVVDTPPGSFDATATLDRLTPWYVTAFTAVGLLVGALIGWLVTGWASRRTEAATAAVRTVSGTSAVIALALLVPQAVLGFLFLGSQLTRTGAPGKPFWTLSLTYGFGCGFLGYLLLAVALVAAATSRPAEESTIALG